MLLPAAEKADTETKWLLTGTPGISNGTQDFTKARFLGLISLSLREGQWLPDCRLVTRQLLSAGRVITAMETVITGIVLLDT